MKIALDPISLEDALNDPDPLFAKTTVINIKSGAPYDLYIGRANATYNLPCSKWYNPFRLEREQDRPVVLARYRMWLLSQPRLLADIHELRGLVLACWCKDKACHGDVLAELANAPERKRRARVAAVWASPSIAAYWREEARLGSVALERLQVICKESGWDYAATLEALR